MSLLYRSAPKPTWSAPDDDEPEAPAVPEVPAFWSGKAKGGKSLKTPKAEKAESAKSWKSKGSKGSGKSGKTKGPGMFARWEGGSGGDVAFNKDGSSQMGQMDVAKNLVNGLSRTRSLSIGAAVAFIVGGLTFL